MSNPSRPRILFVFTGGTISMRIVPGRGAVPARSGREILADVPGLERHATIVCEDFDRIPGPHWTPARMMELAARLEAFGRGNVPPAMAPAIADAVRAGVPVVVASRCGSGRTAPQYGYDGGGSRLAESGALFSGDLPASKARMKLMLLLGAGCRLDQIAASFESPER